MTRVLFLCGKKQWRSPTACQVFADHPGIECMSAGLSHDAETPVSAELVDWAELISVMERVHKTKLSASLGRPLPGKRNRVLRHPGTYRFMEPALVRLLKVKVTPQLPRRGFRSLAQHQMRPHLHRLRRR